MVAEFGHISHIGNGYCLDGWGAGPFVISVGDRSWRFEDSDRFGPFVLKKDGGVSNRQPSDTSPFWKAHRAWRRQGRRLDDDGITCVFTPLRPTLYRKIGRREAVIVEHGDDDGGHAEIEPPESSK